MAHQPVGNGTSFAITSSNAQSSAISHQSDTLRVVAVGAPAHVAIGTDPTATNANYYVASGQEATISLGRPSSQRVVGITTGATTTTPSSRWWGNSPRPTPSRSSRTCSDAAQSQGATSASATPRS